MTTDIPVCHLKVEDFCGFLQLLLTSANRFYADHLQVDAANRLVSVSDRDIALEVLVHGVAVMKDRSFHREVAGFSQALRVVKGSGTDSEGYALASGSVS